MNDGPDLSPGVYGGVLIVVLVIAATMRGLFPAADAPWNPPVGIVWHDEGAWVHNARNRALFGAWSLDRWNPMYIAPVFTGLEYLSFRLSGVGVRQARLVPEICGFVAVALLALGVRRIGGRLAGLIAAALLGTNYFYVMWDRTALMEGPMVAFMVSAWYCYTRADDSPRWGIAAGACALLAFFTKAAAAFFVAALAIDAVTAFVRDWKRDPSIRSTHPSAWTLAGLLIFGIVALALFVVPHWADYRFYNWQMSVTRKPSYDLKSLIDRATWLPLQDAFTRTWFAMAVAAVHATGLIARWRRLRAGERLLILWVVLGAAELILHDAGNERRFVFFIPAFVGLAALGLGRLRILSSEVEQLPRRYLLFALPLVLYGAYVVFGAFVRIAFLREISPNVRIAAGLSVAFAVVLFTTWPRIPRALSSAIPRRGAVVLTALLTAGNVVQYLQWAVGRTYKNYEASREVGRLLPEGTLVQGKLANGLSLENRIRPIFIGRGFGNYEDRKSRDDVRYILTYIAPSLGYESQAHNPVIQDVIDAYPNHTIVATFEVAETATGHDRAALIDKFGAGGRKFPQSARAKN
jgi:4-amino-4-deoxy-L-arabinose transferase-like glycosyltransferase